MKRTTRLACLGAVSSLALLLAACSGSAAGDKGGEDAAASSYPEKDINFIVQANPGGGSDLSSRALVAELEPILDISIIVENRPGAAGATAMEYVAGEDADGYTIGFVPVEIAMLNHQSVDVDPGRLRPPRPDHARPRRHHGRPNSPYQTLEDLVEAAKSEALSVANSGAGSIWEAATLGLAAETGAKLTPVPYDGGAPALAAAIGGQIDAAVGGARRGPGRARRAVRILAVLHDERHPDMPDVPTVDEASATTCCSVAGAASTRPTACPTTCARPRVRHRGGRRVRRLPDHPEAPATWSSTATRPSSPTS